MGPQSLCLHRLIAQKGRPFTQILSRTSTYFLRNMYCSPPQWLQRWRFLLQNLWLFRRRLYTSMIKPVRLRIWDKEWLLEATPPRLDKTYEMDQAACSHPEFQSYGNATGKYAKCKRCAARFKWDDDKAAWQLHPSSASSRSAVLPLPSSGNILPVGDPPTSTRPRGSTPKTRAARTSALPTSRRTAWATDRDNLVPHEEDEEEMDSSSYESEQVGESRAGCAEPGSQGLCQRGPYLRQGTANFFEATADGGHPGALRWRGKALHDGPRLRPHFLPTF